MRAASFNSRSLVYGCSTLMHASRYACNERAEERVKADMRPCVYVTVFARIRAPCRDRCNTLEVEQNFRLHRTTLSSRKFEDERVGCASEDVFSYHRLRIFIGNYRFISSLSCMFVQSGKKSYKRAYVTRMAKCHHRLGHSF